MHLRWKFWLRPCHGHPKHHHHHHHKAKYLNLMLFTLEPGGAFVSANPIEVKVGKPVLFSIAPTDAAGADASADVPAAGVSFVLSNPAGATLTVNPDGYSGTIIGTAAGVETVNVTAALNSGGSLSDSGDITVDAVVSPATALNLKFVAG